MMGSFDDSVENLSRVILHATKGINAASDFLLPSPNRRNLRPVRPRNDNVLELR